MADRALSKGLVAGVLLTLAYGPAWADTSAIQLTGSWQKIATVGQAVDVQSTSGQVFLATVYWAPGTGLPEPAAPANSTIGQHLAQEEHRCFNMLSADLYAKAGSIGGSVVVMDGLVCSQGR